MGAIIGGLIGVALLILMDHLLREVVMAWFGDPAWWMTPEQKAQLAGDRVDESVFRGLAAWSFDEERWREWNEDMRRWRENFARAMSPILVGLADAKPEGLKVRFPKGFVLRVLPREVRKDPTFVGLIKTCKQKDFGPFLVTADYLEERGCTELAHAFRWCAKNKKRPYQFSHSSGSWIWAGPSHSTSPVTARLPVSTWHAIAEGSDWATDLTARMVFEHCFLVIAFALDKLRKEIEA